MNENRSKEPERTPLRSPEFVSDYMGVPIPTLYNWRTQGKGPRAIRVGRHLRYRQSDIDAWIEEHADPMPA